MVMTDEFLNALRSIATEDNIPDADLLEIIRKAMEKGMKHDYPELEDALSLVANPETREVKTYITKKIVDDVPTFDNEININDAIKIDPAAEVGGTVTVPYKIKINKKVVDGVPLNDDEININNAIKINPDAQIGDIVEVEKSFEPEFTRAAAQMVKQALKGDIRQITRGRLAEKYSHITGDIISAEVIQVDSANNVTLQYDGDELYLLEKDQIPGETFVEGQPLTVYVAGISTTTKRPTIRISRRRKEFVERLFERDIPEVYDGTVEIKSVSREAGSRTKIAVYSNNKDVDAVSACIGMERKRIQGILHEINKGIPNELNHEKIDIIEWDEKPEKFISNALSPAKVVKVVLLPIPEKTEEEKAAEATDTESENNSENTNTNINTNRRRERREIPSCIALVPQNQLSLAIGNRGQNAKLAAKLTGYRIDIKSEGDPQALEEIKKIEDMMKVSEDEDDLFGDDFTTEEIGEVTKSDEAENNNTDDVNNNNNEN